MFDVSVFIFISDHESATKLAVIKANLTEERNLLIANLTEERNLLIANLTEVTEELKRLQRLAKKSDLTFLTEKTCPAGWTKNDCVCYLLSNKSSSWDEGRDDCRARGADLVVIDTLKEQVSILTRNSESAWIGLTDRAEEGHWKWVDGTPLTETFWEINQPDNGSGRPQYGEEDCAEIRGVGHKLWNDLNCESQLHWICEQTA
uniref:C-type lectin domain-containing protein n=1 Tax=Echeneis naucrates TaxID=173247 RepID=A0A665X4P7_ECHNA